MQIVTTAPDPTGFAILMQTLGDPTRRGLYEEIVRRGETSVADLTKTATVSQPAVSQHLKALRAAGLVSERRQGRNALYHADARGLEPLVDWLDHYTAFWRDRFADLKALLQEIDPK